MNLPTSPMRVAAAVVATLLVAACGAGPVAEPSGAPSATTAPTEPMDAVTESPDGLPDDADTEIAATAETADDQDGGVESESAAPAPSVSDAPTTAASGAETSAEAPGPPQCDAGSPSVFDSQAPGDVATIETNQIVEGEIEQFTSDVWRIALCEGQVVFLDSLLQCSGDGDLYWRLVTPDGDRAFDLRDLVNWQGRCGGDTGPIEIPEAGEWSIEVYYSGFGDSAGTYKFEVLNVPAPDEFTIEMGQEVRPGQPGQGAGVLEFVGSRDMYSIDLQEGQRVFFDAGESCEGDAQLHWRLVVPDGDEFHELEQLINWQGHCGGDTDPIEITETGTHTIEVLYDHDDEGTASLYSFTLTDASG